MTELQAYIQKEQEVSNLTRYVQQLQIQMQDALAMNARLRKQVQDLKEKLGSIGKTVIGASKLDEGATMAMAQGDMCERPCDQGTPIGSGQLAPTPPQDRDNDYHEKI